MALMKRKKGYYSISAVAKMFSVHQQTVRLYEKEGLIAPKRSAGNTRLFSEDDVNRLEEVIYLTHQLGINLAGVEMILKLKRQIAKMQKDMNKIFESTQNELDEQVEQTKHAAQESAKQLLKMKHNVPALPSHAAEPKSSVKSSAPEPEEPLDSWEVEYED